MSYLRFLPQVMGALTLLEKVGGYGWRVRGPPLGRWSPADPLWGGGRGEREIERDFLEQQNQTAHFRVKAQDLRREWGVL